VQPRPPTLDRPEVEEVARMPRGFSAGAVPAGIKSSGGPDLGVLVSTGEAASVAAAFTQNLLPAAPVRLCRAHLARTEPLGAGLMGRAMAVISTSGCANAATGPEGEQDQAALAAALAAASGTRPELTLAISTGLIGTRLPVEALRSPLADLVRSGLDAGDRGLAALGEQMCTTDKRPKSASVRLELTGDDGRPRAVTVSGVAKGVGMIHPRMATMLAIVLTDAAAAPAVLHEMLGPIVTRTWNQLSIDGDTSTNDTVLLLASGASGAAPVATGTDGARALAEAIEAVARSLARQQAADGEGATTLITCRVEGARDDTDARAVARGVVASSLVKAAVHGRDPNWGRIAAAAGNAGVALDEGQLRIAICGVPVFNARPLPFDAARLAGEMAAPEVEVVVGLGVGPGSGEAFGCDLSEEYVVENSAYST
jgi:glutamate N-acetyltransferase/amino-acid N-acetyltransferase